MVSDILEAHPTDALNEALADRAREIVASAGETERVLDRLKTLGAPAAERAGP